jgi:hypothetical protein
VLLKGPVHLDSVCEGVLSLSGKLHLADESLRGVESSTEYEEGLQGVKDGCNDVLLELEGMLARSRANHGNLEGVTDIRRKVLEQVNHVNEFLDFLRR